MYSPGPVTTRPCPSSTGGGWAVDPSLPLPTLGQVVAQLSGSAASTANPSGLNPTAPKPAAPNSTDVSTDISMASTAGQGGSSSATSTTAQGSAAQFEANILLFLNRANVAGCVLAIMTIGVGVFLLL